jgi:serine-type D-Ala-D-Ala carboxypeptidase/endopeptidase (penicillin-binding protein 4)
MRLIINTPAKQTRSEMRRIIIIISLLGFTFQGFSQEKTSETLLGDSSLTHASVSLCVADAETGDLIIDYNSGISLAPASVMKVITSAAALELLGPSYTFKTRIGYTGTINKRFKRLKGNIVITGGGDPSLGSQYFPDHYKDFINNWVSEIKKLGIKRISGKVISDDSYFDFQPVPGKWLWEDAGNYYGAGAYGLSVFDNSYEIHFKTLENSSLPVMKSIVPEECRLDLTNFLTAAGTDDLGNIFAAPYSSKGWIAGSIPANQEDFVLKASVTDPPLLLARVVTEKLKAAGIKVRGNPSTIRSDKDYQPEKIVAVTETESPDLAELIEVLNHESVNLIAEHLVKELGRKFKNSGSTAAGTKVILEFLKSTGIDTNGMFIEDGSGLSPTDAINTRELVRLLVYMKHNGKYFNEYFASLPDAGQDGTLKNCFKDPVFLTRLKAKSGSMTRVRSYAGYFTTKSGKKMVFSIIINNYSGPSKNIVTEIEENIRDLISKN